MIITLLTKHCLSDRTYDQRVQEQYDTNLYNTANQSWHQPFPDVEATLADPRAPSCYHLNGYWNNVGQTGQRPRSCYAPYSYHTGKVTVD